MFKVLQVKDDNKKLGILKDFNKSIEEYYDNVILEAKDEKSILGYIIIKVSGIYLEIDDIRTTSEDKSIIDMLVYGTIAYAQNRQIFTLKCKNRDLFSLLKGFNSEEIDNVLYINTLKASRCKNK